MNIYARIGAAVGALALAAIGGCSGAPEEPGSSAATESCVANHQIECACSGDELGTQVCRADGSGYDACQCGATAAGCTIAPDCAGCSSCFDACSCQGGDPNACLAQCTSSSGNGGSSGSGSGGSSGTGAAGGTGGAAGVSGSGGAGGASGSGAGGTSSGSCEGCVIQHCASEVSSCSQTAGCLDLVQCAQSSGCYLDDFGCLLLSCGSYLANFGAVQPAMSLGNCAASACATECS